MRDQENYKAWRKAYKQHLKPQTKAYKKAWAEKNKTKLKILAQKKYALTKEQVRAANLKAYYGITEAEYQAMLLKQDKKCGICGISQEVLKYKLHVDHSHQTKQVRGLLCHHCNFGLGNFKDNRELLASASKYLGAVR